MRLSVRLKAARALPDGREYYRREKLRRNAYDICPHHDGSGGAGDGEIPIFTGEEVRLHRSSFTQG